MGNSCSGDDNISPKEESKKTPPVVLLDGCSVKSISDYIKSGNAKNIIVMVGPNTSISSGIPDPYSKSTHLYDNIKKKYDDITNPNVLFELDYFRKNPEPFYDLAKEIWPGGSYGKYKPTVAHYFIRLLHEKGLLMMCLTHNIDGLERLAGVPSEKVISLNGSFETASCIEDGKKINVDEVQEAVENDTWKRLKHIYGGLVKPDVFFMGEKFPENLLEETKLKIKESKLIIVIGNNTKTTLINELINESLESTPRLLINRELVGTSKGSNKGFQFNSKKNYRDVAIPTDTDTGVQILCRVLGWEVELEKLVVEGQKKPLQEISPKKFDKLVNKKF
eukprot:NODE_3941_length_1257_cov_39.993827_g3458_i0.p1 GENE.NODE_3941_length_1257_cov_39.993827_g3458_i0~~NODE_3941_length_1257_cov_39.993827_g3458_i0.p1  ORF type:complete len:335 (+),score=73.11 NODE_3941_length_1257_cov_39.993827_g3458_i0:90-1094(+)